jgi:hypothetical protein
MFDINGVRAPEVVILYDRKGGDGNANSGSERCIQQSTKYYGDPYVEITTTCMRRRIKSLSNLAHGPGPYISWALALREITVQYGISESTGPVCTPLPCIETATRPLPACNNRSIQRYQSSHWPYAGTLVDVATQGP